MKLIKPLLILNFLFSVPSIIHSQDFSNKGKEFWISYSYHVGMAQSGFPQMTLYITSDVNTNYTVEIFGGPTLQTGAITAGSVVTAIIPITYFINNEGLFTGKTIRVLTDKNSVVYSYITRTAVSGATVCLPTQVLGKEYYSVNFTQISNELNSNSYFTIIAVEDNTTVEITPSVLTKNGRPAGVPFTVTLNKGEIYQVLGSLTGTTGVDLTGSLIKSVSSGVDGCKRIAVFSGSGKVSIGCTIASSSDNLYQQLYPSASWGLKYLTIPSFSRPNNYYRIIRKSATTNVYLNGNLIPGGSFINGTYFEFFNSTPNMIESNEPISVAQYFTTQNCGGNGNLSYDPDMIILNPVEQNINKVTLVSSNLVALLPEHHLHAIMRNGGSGISSFKLDGIAVNPASWVIHPSDPTYSYIYLGNVGQGYHTLSSDSGFNALAYGYAQAESYGYSAGANVKDLYQFVSVLNPYATVNFPATCKETPFNLSIVFPYKPTQIKWEFGTTLNALGLLDTTINNPNGYDSTWVVNGRQLYRYSLPKPYKISAIGTYSIKIIANNPTSEGCSGIQEIDYDLQVFNPPVADFNFTTNGCVTEPVVFTDATNNGGRTAIKWHWDFADASTSTVQNPTHTYSTSGSYNVALSVITDVGCISDTLKKTAVLTQLPVASFSTVSQPCIGKQMKFTDQSNVPGGTLVKWTWDFGDGSPVVIATNNADQIHTYAAANTYTVTLKVETSTGCQSLLFSKPITIKPSPQANFNNVNICLPAGTANFTNTSTITDGTQALLTYNWNFGDGTSSTVKDPVHNYSGVGPYTVTLTVTSSNGCVDDTVRVVSNIYAQPKANFKVDSVESCFGGTFNFTDQSTAANSTVNSWFWNFGDGTTSTLQNPNKQYVSTGNYPVKLYINSAVGCVSDTFTMNVRLLQLPTASYTASNPLCETKPLQLTSTSSPNAGTITQYNWTINNVATGGNSSSINYTPPLTGNYTLTLSVLTDKGCTNQTSGNLRVNPKPVASFPLPNVCLPIGTANFNSTSIVSSGSIVNYHWNFGNGKAPALTQNATTNYTAIGPYNVSLTVTTNAGCVDDTVRVLNSVYEQPKASFSSLSEVCLGDSLKFSDQSTALNNTITKWNWFFDDGTTSILQNPAKTFTASGSHSVLLIAFSAVGCQSDSAKKDVLINPLPTANFANSQPACETRNVSFTDVSLSNAGNLVKWTWNFGDSSNMVLNSPTPFNHVYTTAGNYNATLQVETNKGCVSAIKNNAITIHANPFAGFVSPEICLTDPFAPFADTSKVSSGNIVAWKWDFGDQNANASNPNTSTSQHPTHKYLITGNYTASLIVTSNQGCMDTVSQSFTVNGSVPAANFSIQNSNTLCSNKNVIISDNSTVDFGSIVNTTIYWDYTNDTTIQTKDVLPSSGKNYSHLYPEFGTPATKTYTIRMVSFSGINCLNAVTKSITVLATPIVQFGQLNEVCTNTSSFQISTAGITNTLPGTGTFSGPGISPTGLFNPDNAGAGTHTLKFTFTGVNSCSNTIDQTITVNPTPIADAGPDKTILEGGSTKLSPVLISSMPVSYLWSPSTALDTVNIPEPTVSPVDNITYTLTVTSQKGCNTSDQVFIKVLKTPQVPNVFSPNGDGIHDRWVIGFLETYPGCTVEIFNRYGQKIYFTTGYSIPWDGTINGKPVPVGTYYYIIDPKNGRKKQSGYVDVIR